jgi:hypothetical protein
VTWRRARTLASLALCLVVCYEAAVAATIHVPADQPTIQAGINAATDGDTVVVDKGTYKESIDFNGKKITVISAEGPADTVIQGDGTQGVAYFKNSEDRTSVLKGFTIQGGGDSGFVIYGGGVVAVGATPSILDNIITGNQCHALDLEWSGALVEGNTITNTTASPDGYCNFNGSAILALGTGNSPNAVIGNTIAHNKQGDTYDGGAFLLWAVERMVIESNIISDNATTGQGGALAAYNSDAMIIAQNLFYGNSAEYGAGAISILAPDESQGDFFGLVQNNTFAGNIVSDPSAQGGRDSGSQVRLEGNLGQYEFSDNIVVGVDDLPPLDCGVGYNYLSATPLVIESNDIYNAFGPAYGGACPDQTGQYGNISADPLFVSATNDDYHLRTSSPAIDTGNNSALQLLANAGYPLTGDLDGKARVQDATGKGTPIIDMGVYEHPGTGAVTPTTIVLTPSAYNITAGGGLTLTAQLYDPTGTPPGTVTFYQDGVSIGTSPIESSGQAVWTVGSSLVPGTHAFYAQYPGQDGFTPCVSIKIYVIVNSYGVSLGLTSSPNPSLFGQIVTFQIKISAADGVPSGTVDVTDSSTGNTLATLTPDTSGNASFSISTLTIGSHSIDAVYQGNATHAPASASMVQVVIDNGTATSTRLTSSLNPSSVGQNVTFTATVGASSSNGIPDGTISFADGARSLATVTLQNGVAAYSTSSLGIGTHAIGANYSGNSNWAASSATVNQVVNGIGSSTTLTATPDPVYATHSVTLTAQVTGSNGETPTGSVTFLDGNAQLATASLSAGGNAAATVVFSVASSTPHLLTAVYGGDATFSASISPAVQETVLINPTSTAITSIKPNPVAAFHSTTLIAKITSSTSPGGSPGGTVTFATANSTLGTATAQNGSATITVNVGPVGTYAVTARYGGDPAFASSVSPPDTLTVIQEPSAVTLTSSVNPALVTTPVTFKAVATPQNAGDPMTGTITFFDGPAQLGQPVNASAGSASFQTSSLAVGTHAITAVYSGDSNVQSATSPALEQSIVLYTGDFTLSADPSQATVYTGEAARFAINVTPKNGFNYPVDLSCGNLPQEVLCSFTPASISAGQGQATLLLQTTAPQKTATNLKSAGAAAALAAIFAIFLLPRRRPFVWFALIVVAFLGFSGCGSPPQIAGGTPPGVYTITVTAQTSASGPLLQHSTNLTLTVKSLF